MPNVSRACPLCRSMPTRPSVRPRKRLVTPFSVELPKAAETVVKASTISAKYSAGPKESASFTTHGASSASATVAIVPATKEPIAAVASAGPPRPALGHLVALRAR